HSRVSEIRTFYATAHDACELTPVMIPRRFFWTFDVLAIAAAFLIAYPLVALIRPLFSMCGILWPSWFVNLSLPVVSDPELPPLHNLLWVFLSIAPSTIAFLEIAGLYRPLYQTSRTKIIVAGSIAPAAGLSLVTLILFALKNPGWSRLFIF